MADVTELTEEVIDLKRQLAAKNNYIQNLEDAIRQARHRQFGASSEKVSADQGQLFNEPEADSGAVDANACEVEETTSDVKGHTRKKKPRVSIPVDYPREDILHDLPESEKVCPHDGSRLKHIGFDDHEQLDIIPAQVKVLRHRRLKYACPCCAQHIVTASKPKQAIEKSIASPGLLAHITVQKYCDALPLYRQSTIFKRSGIALERSNLSNWMIKVGALVQPLINCLADAIRSQAVVHMDETTVQVLNEPGKTAQSKSYMWLMAGFGKTPATVFHYRDTRSGSVPLALLDNSVAAVMLDGYEGYQKACVDYQITRLGCWAHARRKFVDAQKLQAKGKTGKPDQAIAFIQKLYRIERAIKDDSPEKRREVRRQQAKPIIDQLKQWLEKSKPNIPPSTALGKALTYLHNQWPRLVGYLEDGRYPIDNNPAENAVRPFTIGRKNWLFSQSQAGACASANLYSLIETAKMNGLNPYDYLKEVFTRLPNVETVDDIERLLPWRLEITEVFATL
ncbi:MAG: IS66 family transposase [Gammaproteobacteria bacterium]|nr:IS66 family transposase [Gammaproteobacteria bacterium]